MAEHLRCLYSYSQGAADIVGLTWPAMGI